MSLRIAQITDCHLQAEVTTPYKGVDADAHLDQCLAWLQDHAQVDLLMLTGDLSHFGSEKAYQRLQQKLSRLAFPCVWLAGNHDHCDTMQQVSGQAVQELRVLDDNHWRLVILNTTEQADGRGGGSLAEVQMEELKRVLEDDVQRPVCVFMHHNSVAVNSLWQDDIMLGNAQQFNALVASHSQVKAVVCGHVHQTFDQLIGATRFLATPSSAVQFAIEQQQFKVQTELGPGLRLLTLAADGQIHTQIQRLPKH
jgi:Icc protein|tara:strand:+ start:5804 stop:6562 length:759 start_codon:yes stop_codon:yes gene_type:complete